MSNRSLRITLLASEWKSSKGGLSTINRELAIQLAKHPNVSVSFFVPKCCDEDKRAASRHNVTILEATELPGYDDPVDWLAYPPKDLSIDFIIGHGVVLGKQAQIIRDSHNCKWAQVVHTAPDELAMYKNYSAAIAKGEKKQWNELKLCEMADLVITVGPKLKEFYSAHLNLSDKIVLNFTPGIFMELSNLKSSAPDGKNFRILVFGRGDSEDFELKGFDIAAQAVAALNDRSYHLMFVGAPRGGEEQVAEKLLKQGLCRSQLTVKGYVEDRENLKKLFCASNIAIIPSRTEGFGLTGLEALSAGLPFLICQNSGFGEALQEISPESSFIVDSEDPQKWAEAIKCVRRKDGKIALQECQALKERYANKYSWEKQCNKILVIMMSLLQSPQLTHPLRDNSEPITRKETTTLYHQPVARPKKKPSSSKQSVCSNQRSSNPLDKSFVQQIERENSLPKSTRPTTTPYEQQGMRSKEKSSSHRESASSNTAKTVSESIGFALSPGSFLDHEVPNKNLGVKLREEHPLASLKRKQPYEKPVKAFVAVLGCGVSEYSMQAVMHILDDTGTTVTRQFTGPSPAGVRSYLERENLPRFCVLAVDADAVKRASQNTHQLNHNYADLFKRVLAKVDEKVIILVCADYPLPSRDDEAIVQRSIERAVNFEESDKGFIAWLNNGMLTVEHDVLAQFLNSASTPTEVMQHRSHLKVSKLQSTGPVTSPSWFQDPFPYKERQENAREEELSASAVTKQDHVSNEKAVQVLYCNVSEKSMQAAMHVLEVIDPTGNLSVTPQFESRSPARVKWYLEKNVPRFCVLVVDAKAIVFASQNSLLLNVEYEDLFQTALDRVAERVIILVCTDVSLSPQDEEAVQRSLQCVVGEGEKGFILWLKDGNLSVDPDILAQVLNSATTPAQMVLQKSPSKDVKEQINVQSVSSKKPRQILPPEGELLQFTNFSNWLVPFSVQRQKAMIALQEPHTSSASKSTEHTVATGKPVTVLDWSKLRHGRISYQSEGRRVHLDHILLGDTRLLQTESTVPDDLKQNLFKQFCNTSEADVTIVSESHDKDALRWFVEEKSWDTKEMTENEVLMLKTSVRHGQVSMKIDDLKFRYPEWTVPQCILEKIENDFEDGELTIISDEKGNLRYNVLNSHGLQNSLAFPFPFPFGGYVVRRF